LAYALFAATKQDGMIVGLAKILPLLIRMVSAMGVVVRLCQ
jgi:hypothetical protein